MIFRRLALVISLLLMGICTNRVWADSLQYAYDSLGRVIEAVDSSSGQAIEYQYDQVGNILSITPISISALSIAGLSNSQGAVGDTIAIYGSGFDLTPANNTVQFNGTGAAVLAATSTQLTVTVPTGALSGAVTVANTQGSVTGPNFTVVAAVAGPVLSGFSPATGAAGTVVVLSGSNFASSASGNRVFFNTVEAQVTDAAVDGTSLLVLVPAGVSSGPITVSTAYGTAVSSSAFVVPPPNVYVSSTGTMSVGSGASTSVPVPAYDSWGSLLTFSGTSGQLLTIAVDSLSSAAVASISVIGPKGETVLAKTGLTSSTTAVQLPALPSTGTYSIVVTGGAVGSVNLRLVLPQTGTLTIGAVPMPIILDTPGQRVLMSFAGLQNQFVTLSLSSDTIASANVSIIRPDGVTLISSAMGTAGGSLQPQLPLTGTYTVLVDPSGAIGGGFGLALTGSVVPTLSISSSPSFGIGLNSPKTATFQASQGDYVALNVATTSNSIQTISVLVVGPDGVQLKSGTFNVSCTTSGCMGSILFNLGPLKEGGSYSVTVTEQAGTTGGGAFTLSISNPISKAITLGASVQTTSGYPGQASLVQFQGTAGQYLALNVANVGGNSCGNSGTLVTVLQPDGTPLPNVSVTVPAGVVNSAGACAPGSAVVNLGPLPMTSTNASPYTAVAQQISPFGPAGLGLSFSLSAPVAASVGVNGTVSTNFTQYGQGALVTFQGTAGQYLALNVAETGGNACAIGGATIMVIGPDGVPLSQVGFVPPGVVVIGGIPATTCNPSSTVVNFGPLPLTSSLAAPYTIVVQQIGESNSNSLGLSFTLSNPLTLVAGVNGLVSGVLNYLGEGAMVTFQAAQGQYLALNIEEKGTQSCSLAGFSVKFLKPDGSVLPNAGGTIPPGVTSVNTCSPASAVFNLGPLPVSSTISTPYTVLVQQLAPSLGTGVTLKFTLSSPVTTAMGVNGYANIQFNYLGQSALVTFQGIQGQTLTLTSTETGSNACHISGANIYILEPDATTVLASGVLPAGVSTPPTCGQSNVPITMPALPVTSTVTSPYTILVQQLSPSNADSNVGIRFSLRAN